MCCGWHVFEWEWHSGAVLCLIMTDPNFFLPFSCKCSLLSFMAIGFCTRV